MARRRQNMGVKSGNASIVKVSIKHILSAGAFVAGVKAVRRGAPFMADAYMTEPNKQWQYERGRLFAIVFQGEIKEGRNVLYSAMAAYAEACRGNAII